MIEKIKKKAIYREGLFGNDSWGIVAKFTNLLRDKINEQVDIINSQEERIDRLEKYIDKYTDIDDVNQSHL